MTTVSLLNELTASLGVLYIKLHQHHFYVTGKSFYQLHETFENMYDEVHEHLDEVAERILMLGGSPVSTLGEFLDYSAIKEMPYTTKKTAEEMVKETLADFKIIADMLENGIEKGVDDVTEGMLVDLKTSYDKHIWMLSSTLA